MPAKKEVILQHQLKSDDDYHKMLRKEGLTVVDVYAKWCGPCKAIVSLFRRLRNELGGDMLRFALAEADGIEALKEYRGRSQPTFLFVATGEVLVKVIRGADGPLIEKTIVNELKQEHMALEGQVDRAEFNDTFFEELAAKRAAEEAAAEAERNKIVPIRKQLALMVLKPDVLPEQAEEIVQKTIDAGFQVLKRKEMTFEREVAEELFSSLKEESNYEEHIEHITSGPNVILIITKKGKVENLIADLREIVGPIDVEDAQDNYPESIRALYGRDKIRNAFHLSSSKISAEREIVSLFPRFKAPWIEGTAPETQQAVLVIGPMFVENQASIIEQFTDSNACVLRQRSVQLEQDDVETLYPDCQENANMEEITAHMVSAESTLVLLEHEEIIGLFSETLGAAAPKDGDASLGSKSAGEGTADSLCLYSSASLETAARDVNRFFPMQQTLAIIKPHAMERKEEILEEISNRGFVIAMQEEKELQSDVVADFYAEHKEKDFYASLVEAMCSGPVETMILSSRDGIQAWRDALGPTSTIEAKEQNPGCLRAKFGGEEFENALHGSASAEEAQREVELIFGEGLEFGNDGRIKSESEEEDGEAANGEEATTAAAADGGETNGDAAAEAGNSEEPNEAAAAVPAEGGDVEAAPAAETSNEAENTPAAADEEKAEAPTGDNGGETADAPAADGDGKEDSASAEARAEQEGDKPVESPAAEAGGEEAA
eukprot:scpid3757/ scgid11737/ Thioredoxin domain-containing protein 3 homolog; Dynein intermediate chain 3